jgi:hypothetical protein
MLGPFRASSLPVSKQSKVQKVSQSKVRIKDSCTARPVHVNANNCLCCMHSDGHTKRRIPLTASASSWMPGPIFALWPYFAAAGLISYLLEHIQVNMMKRNEHAVWISNSPGVHCDEGRCHKPQSCAPTHTRMKCTQRTAGTRNHWVIEERC